MKSIKSIMTKKYSIAILLLALFCKVEWSHAQNFHIPSRGNQDLKSNFSNGNVDNTAGMHKIQSIKMDYISDNLRLSSEEADKFWPVYNQYQKELNLVMHQKRQNMLNSSKNPQDIVNDNLDYDSKILNIKKHYKDEFAKILPSDKLARFYKSERSFNDEMIKRLKYQKGTDGN